MTTQQVTDIKLYVGVMETTKLKAVTGCILLQYLVRMEMTSLSWETTTHSNMVMVVTEMTSFMVVTDSTEFNRSLEIG